jgi:hypothetical protein
MGEARTPEGRSPMGRPVRERREVEGYFREAESSEWSSISSALVEDDLSSSGQTKTRDGGRSRSAKKTTSCECSAPKK